MVEGEALRGPCDLMDDNNSTPRHLSSFLALSVLTTSTTVYSCVHNGSDKHVHASLQLDRARKYR
jgi:hypothetical protein